MPLLRRKGLYETGRVIYLHPDVLHPNPNQPRKRFSPDGLEERAASIREHGVLQPLTVRKVDGSFELVSGERRLRAARMAGLSEVPCIVIDVDGVCSSLLALVENLQRKDLDFWEEALALEKLISTYHLSQEEAARRIGKSQSAVGHKLRLGCPAGRWSHRAPRPCPAPPGGSFPAGPGRPGYPGRQAYRRPNRGAGPGAPPPPENTHRPPSPADLCGQGHPPVSQHPGPGDGPDALRRGGRQMPAGGP